MSTVIAFPAPRTGGGGVEAGRRRRELAGPKVVILPVVRIERHGVEPQGTGASACPAAGPEGATVLSFGLTPTGRPH